MLTHFSGTAAERIKKAGRVDVEAAVRLHSQRELPVLALEAAVMHTIIPGAVLAS